MTKSLPEHRTKFIHWSELLLDVENPRLPENLQNGRRSEILRYLFEEANLLSLIRSMLKSGFFPTEPLIVKPDDENAGKYVVLEGNRRFGALLIIHAAKEASELQKLDELGIKYTPDEIARLTKIPCLVYQNRSDVKTFLGFRHIGGLEKWDPEAKARYLLKETRELVDSGDTSPFYTLGRQVGSNKPGVRSTVIAILILFTARDLFDIDVTEVQRERFGVWTRLLNTAEVRNHIGLEPSLDEFSDVERAMEKLSKSGLEEVLGHLSGGKKAVLKDSRDATIYGQVLASKKALEVLRSSENLALAKVIVEKGSLASRLEQMAERIDILKAELEDASYTSSLGTAAETLFNSAKKLSRVVKLLEQEQKDDDEDEDD